MNRPEDAGLAAGARTVLRRLGDAPRGLLMGLVRAYRLLLSPWLGSACRFEPSCSAYALQALERHGALGGSALAAWRILRCHPGCAGGHDPVPDNAPWRRRRASADPYGPASSGPFTRLLPNSDAPAGSPPGTADTERTFLKRPAP